MEKSCNEQFCAVSTEISNSWLNPDHHTSGLTPFNVTRKTSFRCPQEVPQTHKKLKFRKRTGPMSWVQLGNSLLSQGGELKAFSKVSQMWWSHGQNQSVVSELNNIIGCWATPRVEGAIMTCKIIFCKVCLNYHRCIDHLVRMRHYGSQQRADIEKLQLFLPLKEEISQSHRIRLSAETDN